LARVPPHNGGSVPQPDPKKGDRQCSVGKEQITMKKETILLVIIAAAVIAFGAGRMSNTVGSRQAAPAQPATVAPQADQAAAPGGSVGGIPATMPVKGPENALVTIVEVSDFQCPFCSRVGPTIKELMKAYPNDIRIVWANQPLPFHNNAKPAAIAALAAHKQGKFWEMHAKLFANQRGLTRDNFVAFAKELGLNVDKFQKDLDDPALKAWVKEDMAEGSKFGVNGTPASFINGRLVSGAQPFDAFKAIIDEELKKKS
jgi:protein-disulfide isomerase